jgi:excisionase family DNA binding protein
MKGGATMDGAFYNIRHASTLLGVKVRTIREWIKNGKLNAIKYPASNRWYIPASEIDRLTKSEGV